MRRATQNTVWLAGYRLLPVWSTRLRRPAYCQRRVPLPSFLPPVPVLHCELVGLRDYRVQPTNRQTNQTDGRHAAKDRVDGRLHGCGNHRLLGGSAGNPGEHLRPDLFVVVKREGDIGPAVAAEGAVGSGLAFEVPAGLEESSQDVARLRRRPVTHAARKLTLSNSAGASACSKRSASTRRASA